MDAQHQGGLVDYYGVLGIARHAPRITIREAYLRLKSTYSPGSTALYSLLGSDEAKSQLALIEEAFRVLSDEIARREFDQKLADLHGEAALERSGALASPAKADAAFDSNLAWSLDAGGFDTGVVRTTRSTLPVIKLKATPKENIEQVFSELIKNSDPADGDLFRRLREAAGVSEDEIQERTKISVGYVRAMESNRLDRLPQAVYVKGFLRSYLSYLGVPEQEVLVNAFAKRLADWQAQRKD